MKKWKMTLILFQRPVFTMDKSTDKDRNGRMDVCLNVNVLMNKQDDTDVQKCKMFSVLLDTNQTYKHIPINSPIFKGDSTFKLCLPQRMCLLHWRWKTATLKVFYPHIYIAAIESTPPKVLLEDQQVHIHLIYIYIYFILLT